MSFSIRSPIKFFIACLCLSGLLSNSSIAQQSGDDYLLLLEGEANSSTIDKKTQAKKEKEKKVTSITSSIDGKIPPGLSLGDFMQNLKSNYIGTYFFAKRLSDPQKNEIYFFYQENNDPQAIRTKIIEISKKN